MNRTVTTRIAERALARRKRRGVDLAELFPDIEFDVERPRRPSELRQIWRAVRAESLPAQLVLIVGLVTIAYLLLIFGMVLGVAIEVLVGA
jgi:hypothetical protein